MLMLSGARSLLDNHPAMHIGCGSKLSTVCCGWITGAGQLLRFARTSVPKSKAPRGSSQVLLRNIIPSLIHHQHLVFLDLSSEFGRSVSSALLSFFPCLDSPLISARPRWSKDTSPAEAQPNVNERLRMCEQKIELCLRKVEPFRK